MMGPSCVGKTSIITQLLDNQYSEQHTPTLQSMHSCEVETGAAQITLTVEDTGGSFIQEFPAMAEVSLQHADGVILVFSVDDEESFEHLSKLKDLISSKHPSLPVVVVGNKTDKTRVLPMEEIEATVCMDWECGYVECSAKAKNNLEGVLRELANKARVFSQVTSAACPKRKFIKFIIPHKKKATLGTRP